MIKEVEKIVEVVKEAERTTHALDNAAGRPAATIAVHEAVEAALIAAPPIGQRVDLKWAQANTATLRVTNGTNDQIEAVNVDVVAMERQLQSGVWFPAEIGRGSMPGRLQRGDESIRPERYADFSFISDVSRKLVRWRFKGQPEESTLTEKGTYRVTFAVEWSTGRRTFEGRFVWRQGEVPVPDGQIESKP